MEDYIKYLQGKDLSVATQKLYAYDLTRFLKWYEHDPINCTKKDILQYLDYLQNVLGVENVTRRHHLLAIDHYFNCLGLKHVTSFIKLRGTKKRKLHHIFSGEELNQLYDDYYHSLIQNYTPKSNHTDHHNRIILLSRQRNYVMLGLLVYQGLATKELEVLHVNDINFAKATITINRKNNNRTLSLQAVQIGAFMHYLQNIRPEILTEKEDTEKLFLPLSERDFRGTKNNLSIRASLRLLFAEVKTLHVKFYNLTQLRTSVISNWIKTEGLRKTQHLAGHKSIVSTEEYRPNNLDELTDDLSKFNSF
jgi:site-specific recombinase XerD